MKRLLLLTLMFLAISFAIRAQVVWQEDFTGVANNATVDAGATAWSVTTLPGGQFRKQDTDPYFLLSESFIIRNTGTEGVWTSEDIDISAYGIAIIDITITNIFTSGTDYVSVYYQSNSGSGFGSPIPLITVTGGVDQTVGQSAIVKGNQIRLIIRGMENTADFFIFQSYFAFDDIVVTGVETLYSRKTGTWNDITAGNGSWSPFPITAGVAGTSCDCAPDNTKRAVVQNGHTISIGSAADATIVDVEAGGTLRWTSANDLSLHRGGYLQNEGTVSRNGVANARIVFSEVYPFTITNNGTFSVDDIVMNAAATLTINGTNAVTINDDLEYASDNATVNNSTTLLIGSSIQVNSANEDGNIFNNTDTVSVAAINGNNGDFTINNSSKFGLIGAITNLSTATRFNNLSAWWWLLNNNTIPANFGTTMVCTTVGNTFYYSGTANQNIGAPAAGYYNLTLRNGGTKTASALLDVNGNLTVKGVTLAGGINAFDVEGSIIMTGASSVTGSGAVAVNTDINMSNTAGWSGSGTATITGSLNMSPTPSAPTWTGNGALNVAGNFNLAGGTYTGNGNIAIGSNYDVSGGTYSGTGTIDVNGNLDITAGAVNGTNSVTIGGNWSAVSATSFDQASRTVTFDGAGSTITNAVGETFYNLVINNGNIANTVTLQNDVTVTNTLTLTRGRLTLNGRTLNITRNNTGAITGGSANSYIVCETTGTPYAPIVWSIGATNGTFTFPFGTTAGSYIPYVLTKQQERRREG